MQIHFTGRNLEVTPALKTFTTEKMERLERRFNNITNIHVSFHVENLTQTAEATVHISGADIHASSQSNDMYTAIDELIDKLLGQITKHKDKQTGHR